MPGFGIVILAGETPIWCKRWKSGKFLMILKRLLRAEVPKIIAAQF
jgi:hypothetical protein